MPNSSLEVLLANFAAQGLDSGDLVALSGSHTIGKSRCTSFKPRIYNVGDNVHDVFFENDNQEMQNISSTLKIGVS
ncbi:hypothetical protein Scep_026025 [Stephania cephalantha]|uniref:Plant heme peroxidase family profile domain-containing protein n=1 Tax=Stephania cephalantha TaxID=152367 RepID=A0AAP0EJD0_9MAGN